MADQQRINDLPLNLDLLYNSEYQAKLRELARQPAQDLFGKNDKVTVPFNPQISLQSISPTPSTSSTSSTASSNIRHFKKALILQSNLEEKPTADIGSVSDAQEKDDEEEEETRLQIVSDHPMEMETKSEDEADNADDISDQLNATSDLSVSSEKSKTFEPKNGKIDFSIKSLSTSKYSSDDEALNRSSVGRTDTESVQSEDMKDDSLKEINTSDFDFLRPSTSGLSSFAIPPMSLSSSTPITNQQFTTMSDMPTMVPTHVGRKPLNGPPCSLKTLVDDNILDPLDGSLTYEIMGAKFLGDLLPNGFIRLNGTSQVFANPSSWANFCRSTIPSCSKDQKNFGSAWSIIRYLGKRLDSYKLRWYRKQKKQYMGNGSHTSPPNASQSNNKKNFDMFSNYSHLLNFPTNSLAGMANLAQFGASNLFNSRQLAPVVNRDRLHKLDKISLGDQELNSDLSQDNENEVLNFQSIDLNRREETLTDSSKVKTVSFSSVFCMQPFLVTIQSNALMLVNFHSHLTNSEVIGYLGGIWESRTQHLNITSAFPFNFTDPKEIRQEMIKIKQELQRKGQILVGWYHSHPDSTPQPTVKDIKQQLKYQKEMLTSKKGLLDYSPCVGLIVAPYYQKTPKMTSIYQMFWVMPMYVQNCRDFGRPMQIAYTLARDSFLTSDLLAVMRFLAQTYGSKSDSINFKEEYRPDCTFYRKIKESLKPILPRDLIPYEKPSEMQDAAIDSFWNFIRALLLPPTLKPNKTQSSD